MITDARSLESGFELQGDVCIVGAGAAGITLASTLNGGGLSVLLLESGGFQGDLATQALYRGTYAGNVPTLEDGYLSGSRLRFFGGTTNHWGGWSRPLEAIDFEQRDWVPDSGWPVSKAELDPYFRRASKLMGIGDFDHDNPDRGRATLPPTLDDDVFEGRVYRFHAKRFGRAHRTEITGSRNVRLVHHANAVEIATGPSGGAVDSIRVATLDGVEGRVKARVYVLAAGGIENCRLLLASDAVQPGGVGNQHDQVGRYFMEHAVTHQGMGPMFVWPSVSMEIYKHHGTPVGRAQFLYLNDRVLRERKMLNVALVMTPGLNRDVPVDLFDRALMHASADADRLDGDTAPFRDPEIVRTVYMCEQQPNPDSRVTLTDDVDALGMRRVQLAWNLTGAELDSIYQFADLLARKVGGGRLGRLKQATPPAELLEVMSVGFHHIGGTRMQRDPKRGVVDVDCRVHGVDNLFVAVSSVFPTSGAANPTFTLVALAIRLADRVAQELAS